MLQLADKQARPSEEGWLAFVGNPYELQEGDVVLNGEYSVLRKSHAKHNGEDATQLVLANAEEYEYETNYLGGEPEERGRVTLLNDSSLKFERRVDHFDFGAESELHEEMLDDTGYEDYETQWTGPCKDVPHGMVVVFGERAETRVIDTAYANGVVIFEDGSAYQSHPDRQWIGWIKQ